MNATLLPFHPNPSAPWHAAFARLGLARDNGRLRLDDITLKPESRWLTLERVRPSVPEPCLLAQLGGRGLWKTVTVGERQVQRFEFPESAVDRDDVDRDDVDRAVEPEDPTAAEAILAWALASRDGDLAGGWQAPDRDAVQSWLPGGGLTVQCGPLVRQGELILNSDRWALRFPILSSLPTRLPLARRRWLRRVLIDAMSCWRMTRLGLANGSDGKLAVFAEVDFTGAPPSQDLFSAGLDSVRQVVAWLAETVELLADASVASELLASPPLQKTKLERRVE